MAWVYVVSNKTGSLTLEQMQNNAKEMYNQLGSLNWTLNAICGMLGNVQLESYINPAQYQIGYPIGTKVGGFGLVQFTPSTKYTNWATKNGHSIYDGYWQTYCIDTQENGTQYIKTDAFPLTYDEYKVSRETLDYLTECFLKNYERAGVEALQKRIDNAYYWYEYLTGQEPPTPPTPPKPSKGGKLKVWAMCKRR